MARLAEASFGSAAPARDPAPVRTDPAPTGSEPAGPEGGSIRIVDAPGVTQPQIRIGRIGAARASPDYHANLVASYILGGSFASRLVEEVRVRRGLTYRIGTRVPMLRDRGPAYIATFTPLDSTRTMLAAVAGVVRAFLDEGPTEGEMDRARSYFPGSYVLGLETADEVAERRIEAELYGLPQSSVEQFPGRIRAVRREDVIRVARELFDPASCRILVYGPAESLRPLLEPLGAVEVVGRASDGP
jgi:zinc protease